MSFNLGNFSVKEIIYGTAQNFSDELLYTLDQLSSAEIQVEAESTDIKDKNGAIIRTVYTSKSASLNATSALISPAILNAGSGSEAMIASTTAPIVMPRIINVAAGSTINVSDIATDAVPHVMGIYPNGANGDVLTQSTAAGIASKTFAYDSSAKTITVPNATETPSGGGADIAGAPTYIVKYNRNVESGMALVNRSDEFPSTIRLTLYAAIMDPCQDKYRAAYIYIPSFTPDPSVTISLNVESQEIDYNGNVNLDMCGGDKVLYYIYFPDEDAVVTGSVTA